MYSQLKAGDLKVIGHYLKKKHEFERRPYTERPPHHDAIIKRMTETISDLVGFTPVELTHFNVYDYVKHLFEAPTTTFLHYILMAQASDSDAYLLLKLALQTPHASVQVKSHINYADWVLYYYDCFGYDLFDYLSEIPKSIAKHTNDYSIHIQLGNDMHENH